MVKLLIGGKGAGKTKRLIEMANASVKTINGHIVFIDDDKRHIYDLNYDIRFVETADYSLANYREFIGFIYGVLSQNSDIEEIYIDGLHNIIGSFNFDDAVKLVERLSEIGKSAEVRFVISMNANPSDVPESIKPLMI